MTRSRTQASETGSISPSPTRAMVFLQALFKSTIVNICDDRITLSTAPEICALIPATNLSKTPVKCLLDETP
jgi:hypothetical protein